MADASITLKLSPAEFDLVRDAVAEAYANARELGKHGPNAGARHDSNAKAVQLQAIVSKLR